MCCLQLSTEIVHIQTDDTMRCEYATEWFRNFFLDHSVYIKDIDLLTHH